MICGWCEFGIQQIDSFSLALYVFELLRVAASFPQHVEAGLQVGTV